ncbi:flagellar biosynthetic protein FliO [Mesorhizobium sp. SP-1A]|uniref:flagellar biosynthetic protein FliO n=1 Tax=Mesorhizobium sp. SP-1A TaxID=3077840 RepID=UPI0028F6C3A2|nr:flagellar biosynthetic protein FliO [Mesorhizobium sp. SP-1A]
MQDWLDGMGGSGYAAALLWTFAALLLLIVVLIVIRLIRSLTFGTFVAGGRNRKTRLAVMDATAVDSHRRLVLVRRDDIEHLLLIGGTTDLVVERDIRLVPVRRPATTGDAGHPQAQAGSPVARPRPQNPAAAMPAQSAPARQQPQAPRHAEHSAQAAPSIEPMSRPVASPVGAPSAANQPVRQHAPLPAAPLPVAPATIDEALLRELEVSLDEPPAVEPAAKTASPSLDDEMAKLLGELANHKK